MLISYMNTDLFKFLKNNFNDSKISFVVYSVCKIISMMQFLEHNQNLYRKAKKTKNSLAYIISVQ
jgi:hypothetical protein